MRVLTDFFMMTEIFGYSHRMIITRALIHTGLWWPLWWLSQWVQGPLGATLGKLIFYINNFYMAMFWFLIYSIAKGNDPSRRDMVKYLAFWLAIHVLLELPFLMSQFSWPHYIKYIFGPT